MNDLPDVETDLPDLRDVSLNQVRQNWAALEVPTAKLLKQIERPRFNLGTGPPGRAD